MRKNSKILCILTMFFVLLPLFWIFGEKDAAAAIETQALKLHKRQFENYPNEKTSNTRNEITDFGDIPL